MSTNYWDGLNVSLFGQDDAHKRRRDDDDWDIDDWHGLKIFTLAQHQQDGEKSQVADIMRRWAAVLDR